MKFTTQLLAFVALLAVMTIGAFAAMNFVRDSGQITYLNTGAAISAGDVISLGNRHGVALGDIAATTGSGIVATVGIFDLTLQTNETIAVDAALYYDVSETALTATASGNQYLGLAVEAKTTTTSTAKIEVDLNAADLY